MREICIVGGDDRVEYAKEESLKHRESGYPILDENDQIVGMMNRYHLLQYMRRVP